MSDPVGKLVLLEMAQSWLELAERAAGNVETTVVGVAATVSGTPPSD